MAFRVRCDRCGSVYYAHEEHECGAARLPDRSGETEAGFKARVGIGDPERPVPFPTARGLANETYGEKHRRLNRERQRRWRALNKDKRAAYMREWRARQKEECDDRRD